MSPTVVDSRREPPKTMATDSPCLDCLDQATAGRVLHEDSHAVQAAVVFLLFAVGTVAQLLLGGFPSRRVMVAGLGRTPAESHRTKGPCHERHHCARQDSITGLRR